MESQCKGVGHGMVVTLVHSAAGPVDGIRILPLVGNTQPLRYGTDKTQHAAVCIIVIPASYISARPVVLHDGRLHVPEGKSGGNLPAYFQKGLGDFYIRPSV